MKPISIKDILLGIIAILLIVILAGFLVQVRDGSLGVSKIKNSNIAVGQSLVLHKPALPVENISSPEVQSVIQKMIEAHYAQGGVGIAAPQIKKPMRMFVMQITPKLSQQKNIEETPVMVFINPKMEVLDTTGWVDWEMCLSLPGQFGEVERASRIRYEAFDRYGNPIKGELEGYQARIFQHEMDHLNGVLFTSRIDRG